MKPDKINHLIFKKISLPHYQIRKDMIAFMTYINKRDLILDVGSGAYRPFKGIISGGNYFGIDLFEPSDIKADIKSIPVKTEIADIVLCTEVLEHVPEPIIVLNEIKRVLKKDGLLILTIPFVFGEHDYVDYQRWTEAGIRKILTENGFNILAFRRRGGLFSTIGCLIYQIPIQVFGSYKWQRNIFVRLLFFFAVTVLLPTPWILSAFDVLDRQRNFPFGFSILCAKS